MSRSASGALAASAALAATIASTAFLTSAAGGSGAAQSTPAKHGVHLHTLAHFNQPTFAAGPPHSKHLVFVTERPGQIKVLHGDRKGGTFLDMRHWVSCCQVETGLFSIAFPPDYNRTRKFYVYFTNRQENIEIDQFKRLRQHPAKANRGSRRKIIEINQTGPVNHNGGTVAIASNGLLYAATGDGGNFMHPSHAPQHKNSLLGKLIRIDPRPGKHGRHYRIPKGNPYVGKPGRDAIYARGLRNPFRFSIDRNRILIGDVGEDRREEVDAKPLRKARGANFGWPIYEGTLRFRHGHIRRPVKPIFQYSHKGDNCAITGGVVIRDKRLRGLRGRYIYGDYCLAEIRTFKLRKGRAREDRALNVRRANGPVAFGEGGSHHVYVVELNRGRVSRIAPR